MEELSLIEVQDVNGGIDTRMVQQGGILLIAGALVVATGGFGLVAVGSFALGAGATWAGLGFSIRNY